MFYNLAKGLRNKKVLPYIKPEDNHLDIGCGDNWLLDHTPAHRKMGITDHAERWLLELIDGSFTKITLVAVLEHLEDPPAILRECLRLLSPRGQIIITAPTIFGQIFVPMVDHYAEREHKRVITLKYLRRIVPRDCTITRKFFEFWLNQIFVIERGVR